MPDQVRYAFFKCEDCCKGFAVEETAQEPVECPICPVCGCEYALHVGVVLMSLPLTILTEEEIE